MTSEYTVTSIMTSITTITVMNDYNCETLQTTYVFCAPFVSIFKSFKQ